MDGATAQNLNIAELTQEWLIACKAGDSQVFGKVIEAHQQAVYGLIFRMTHQGDVADDLTQETFVAAWRKLSSFRGTASFRSWLLKIATNKVRSYWRWKKLRNWVSLDGVPNEDGPSIGDMVVDGSRVSNPVLMSEDSEFQARLQTTLMDLSNRQREVIVLRAQGLELHEIASVLGMAVGTVKAHLFEAKQRLREKLGVKV